MDNCAEFLVMVVGELHKLIVKSGFGENKRPGKLAVGHGYTLKNRG
jgi:hypothetical protein